MAGKRGCPGSGGGIKECQRVESNGDGDGGHIGVGIRTLIAEEQYGEDIHGTEEVETTGGTTVEER